MRAKAREALEAGGAAYLPATHTSQAPATSLKMEPGAQKMDGASVGCRLGRRIGGGVGDGVGMAVGDGVGKRVG